MFEDSRARKRLAELLVSDESVRLAIISAVLRDVATEQNIEKLSVAFKQDLERLRSETRQDLDRLENRLRNEFNERFRALESRLNRLEDRVGYIE